MAKINVQGIDTLNAQLTRLGNDANKINRGALGAGAGQVAELMSGAIESLPTHEPGRPKKGSKLVGATEDEKSQLAQNFGIAKFKTSGGKIDTSIGFTGYVHTYSHRFNDEIPTGMLMQAIEYGSEERTGTHTISKAINQAKSSVTDTMQDYIIKKVNEIMK